MGLIEKIGEYCHKVDDFLLEKHIEAANWANYTFGKSNYELSNYATLFPIPIVLAEHVYRALNPDAGAITGNTLKFVAASLFAYSIVKENKELEMREEISLESMTKDPYVVSEKEYDRVAGFAFFALASISIPILYTNASSLELPIFNLFWGYGVHSRQLSALSFFSLFSGWCSSSYFKSIDYKPKSKGRVPQAVENALNHLLRKPISAPSQM